MDRNRAEDAVYMSEGREDNAGVTGAQQSGASVLTRMLDKGD